MTHSRLINGIQLTSDSSSRGGRAIDRFIVHHAATTSLAAILSLFQPGGRTVSANYALGNDGTLILAVDEDRSAWTSGTQLFDGRAVTIEVANSQAGGSWPVSDASFDKLARLIADVATRYDFPINDNTVLTHQELYTRYGVSYATACPGDLQRRKAELIGKANYYKTFGSAPAGGTGKTIEEIEAEELMSAESNIIKEIKAATAELKPRRVRNRDTGEIRLVNIWTGFDRPVPNLAELNAVLAEYIDLTDEEAEVLDVDGGTFAFIVGAAKDHRKAIAAEVAAKLKEDESA